MFDLKKTNYDEYMKNLKTIIASNVNIDNDADLKLKLFRCYRQTTGESIG